MQDKIAKDYLNHLVDSSSSTIRGNPEDRYKRTVAELSKGPEFTRTAS